MSNAFEALDPPPRSLVESVIRAALAEDLAGGVDVTSEATISADLRGTARVVARGDGVVAGLPVAEVALELAGARVTSLVPDGSRVSPGTAVLRPKVHYEACSPPNAPC